MPTAEKKTGFAGTERPEGRLVALGDVTRAVRLAVAVERDAVVGIGDQGEVDEHGGFGVLGRSVEITGALAVVAAGHPSGLLLLGEHDGVEDSAADGFHGDDASALLVEGGEGDPSFQSLGLQVSRQRRCARERFFTIQDEPTIPDHGATFEFRRQLTGQVLSVLLEGPPRRRRRTGGGRASLQPGAKFQGGKGFFHRLFLALQRVVFGGGGFQGGEPAGERPGLVRPLLRQGRAEGGFRRNEFGAVRVQPLGRIDGDLGRTRRCEDAVEGGEVGLADGVELVVVATGAGDGEAEESLRDDVDLVVDVLDLFVRRVERLVAVFDQAEVARPDAGFVDAFLGVDARLFQEIAGQLLADELVIRHVGIERADEVVAIAPRLFDHRVAFAAAGIGIADEVHPVAGEVFAVARRGQQAVNDLGESVG